MLQIVVDGGFEFGDAMEDAAADAILRDQAEEAPDRLSQEAEVGVKCIGKRGWRASHAFTLGCLCVA